MNPNKIFIAALCCIGFCLPSFAQGSSPRINPLTQAMLDGYAALLEQNPNDYLTLYERASQYYRLDNYDKALSDIKRALNCTPAKEKDQISAEYALLADIYIQLSQYTDASAAIDNALTLTPGSYSLLYKKGNVCLHLNQYKNAANAFSSMQRINPRSAEALFGLARAAAMEGKTEDAKKYLNDAVKLDPSNYLTFCRSGDVYRLLGMNAQAAADYLNSFSISSGAERPMRGIMDLAREDYEAVEEAIDYAISKTKNVIPLYFLSGNAALAAERYTDAYNAYRQLLAAVPEDEAATLYSSMAKICLHRGEINEADTYATKVLMTNSDLETNLLKAIIEQARGNLTSAAMYVKRALAIDPTNHDALMRAAEISYGNNSIPEALSYLNEAILNNAIATDALLFRAYIQANKTGNREAALADYSRVAALPASSYEDITDKAIAQVKSGMALDANTTIASVRAAADKNAKAAYLTALFFMSSDMAKDAAQMLEKAEQLGFEDMYLLKYCTRPLFTVSGLTATKATGK